MAAQVLCQSKRFFLTGHNSSDRDLHPKKQEKHQLIILALNCRGMENIHQKNTVEFFLVANEMLDICRRERPLYSISWKVFNKLNGKCNGCFLFFSGIRCFSSFFELLHQQAFSFTIQTGIKPVFTKVFADIVFIRIIIKQNNI